MTNHNCKPNELRTVPDGKSCMICGNFFADQVTAQVEIDIRAKCCPALPSLAVTLRNPQSPVAKRERCTAYMKEVFNTIAEELIKLKSWNQIHLMLAGRESCGKVSLLKKYYQIELAERMENA